VKVTFKCHIETPTESITEEYMLDAAELTEWQGLTEEEQERWKDTWAETVFLNACSYGTELKVER
jgi:hypothetical protein